MPQTSPLNPQTVAVLPLHNQSADPEQEYFCDGITDDIIYALSRIPRLNVIGHTGVFAFKGVTQDVREIGVKLGAGTVVGGTVRKSGNQLKIFTEILDATTGEVHWAQTYERPMEDIFAVEAEIAEAVARVLQMTLAPPVSRGLVRSAPHMDAYLLYLRGRHAWNRASADGYRTAVEIFERTTSMFPSYASAYAGLADAYARLALWGLARPREVAPKALRAAQQALRLDPSLPHAYSPSQPRQHSINGDGKRGLPTLARRPNLSLPIHLASTSTVVAYWYGEKWTRPANASSGPLIWTPFPSGSIVRSG